jgi:magnesium-protoporphyrin O-methyltransferase
VLRCCAAADNRWVPACCSAKGYRWVFSERRARSEAKRYRRRGLDRPSRRILALLREQVGATRDVLEIGGGIGALQIELLRSGVARAVSVELTPTYERVAAELLRTAGLEDRVERKLLDFAESSGEVEPADMVIMNRVLCCYPDMPRLAVAAADHAREVLVLCYPKRTWWTQAALAVANVGLRLARRQFHIFLHPPAEILATAQQRGLQTAAVQRGFFWTVAALRRPA